MALGADTSRIEAYRARLQRGLEASGPPQDCRGMQSLQRKVSVRRAQGEGRQQQEPRVQLSGRAGVWGEVASFTHIAGPTLKGVQWVLFEFL